MNADSSGQKRELCLGPLSEFPPGERRIVTLGSSSVGVFNVEGKFYALRNYCPHEGAQLCLGKRTGTNEPTERCGEYQWGREGMILRCPWHGWEFDLKTGKSLFDARFRVKSYGVSIRDGAIWLEEKMGGKEAL